ncbi:MAG: sugar phosphate nucleotidyltransferase [Vicinamibacterales bacterium]
MSDTLPAALVLAAGHGTRLRPLTEVRAKPAVPVAGCPLIRRVLKRLANQGISEAVINLHYHPKTITQVVGHGKSLGLKVRYSWESQLLGSAGGPRQALDLLGERFFIINGDTLTDVSLRALFQRHVNTRAQVTMAVTPHPAPGRYGGIQQNKSGHVVGFSRPGAVNMKHFIGVQLAEASVFAGLVAGEPASTVGGIYDNLVVSKPGSIRALDTDARFADVGTPLDYLNANQALMESDGSTSLSVGVDSIIHPSAQLTETVVWDRVTVGSNCKLNKCIITDDVKIPDNVTLVRQMCISAKHVLEPESGSRLGDTIVYPIKTDT